MTKAYPSPIRRIDELGRLVVPKEIRRQLNIRENDHFEVIPTEEGVLFRKYSLCSEITNELLDASVALRNAYPTARFLALDKYGSALTSYVNVPANAQSVAKDASARRNAVVTANKGEDTVIVVPVVIEGEVSGMLMAVFQEDTSDSNTILKTMLAMANYICYRKCR